MPSGPKKRKSARKKKELEETIKHGHDTQEDCSNLEGKVESIPESSSDSVLTTAQKDGERDCLDSKNGAVAVSEGVGFKGNLEAEVWTTDDKNEEDEVCLSENSKSAEQIERFDPTLIQELKGIVEEVESLKGTVIRQLQAIEKVTALLGKIVDDFNNFRVAGGQ